MSGEFVFRVLNNNVRWDRRYVPLWDSMKRPKFNTEISGWILFIMVLVLLIICCGGLIGIIFAMAVLLYRVNVRARHQRQIQDHIETIHAILEEGVTDMEEEIISPDEPPDYEPPPEYSDVLKYIRRVTCGNRQKPRAVQSTSKEFKSSPSNSLKSVSPERNTEEYTQRIDFKCQTDVPESPPPLYENISEIIKLDFNGELNNVASSSRITLEEHSLTPIETRISSSSSINTDEKIACFSKQIFIDIGTSLRENIRKAKSTIFVKNSLTRNSFSDENLVRYFSDSELINIPINTLVQKFKKRSYSANDLIN